ncbi:MAG: inositol monophosphatase [Halolamina sp.]
MSDDDDLPRRLAAVERAAAAGATVAAERFRTDFAVERKSGKTDVVTEADRAAQRRVVEVIEETFPDDAVVGEEEEELKVVPEGGPAWVVDPIDGTNNFVRGVRFWATAVAAVVDGEPVAAANVLPAVGDAYVAGDDGVTRDGEPVSVSDVSDPERAMVAPTIWWSLDRREEYAAANEAIVDRFGDLRRLGCAQGTLAKVADGSLDAAITNVDADPWDTVAGVHLVRQAGGRVTDLNGDRWRHDATGLVASNGAVHDEALAAARAIRRAEN